MIDLDEEVDIFIWGNQAEVFKEVVGEKTLTSTNVMIDLDGEVDTFIRGNQVEVFKEAVWVKTLTSINVVQWWIIGAIACRKIGWIRPRVEENWVDDALIIAKKSQTNLVDNWSNH